MAILSSLMDQVRTRIVDASGNQSRISDDFLRSSLNKGARKYSTAKPQVAAISIQNVTNSDPIDLTTVNAYKVVHVFDSNGEELDGMAHEEVIKLQQSESDTPRYYSEFSKWLFIAPTPVTNYDVTIHYWAYPAEALVNGNDTTWHKDIEDAAVEFAVWECWEALEEPGHAESALRQFQMRLDDAENWLGVSEVRNDYSVRSNAWTLRRV